MLYMPRGCIHQAVAQEGDSAHLTISTYQRWSFADLLQVSTDCEGWSCWADMQMQGMPSSACI